MEHDQRITAVIHGATQPATDAAELAAVHDRLYDLFGNPADTITPIGVRLALADRFPDAEIFQRPDQAEILAQYRLDRESENFPAPGSMLWLDYICGRFAAGGQKADLFELCRLVRHRDGSSDAIAMSSEVLAILDSAAVEAPELKARMVAAGVNLETGAIQFGSYPTVDHLEKPSGRPGARPVVVALPAPAPAAPEPVAAVPEAARAMVEPAGDSIRIGETVVSIRDAQVLSDAIVRTVRAMVLPAEGYSWLDNRDDPQKASVLLLLDVQAKQAAGLLESPAGGLVQADVVQFGAGGSEISAVQQELAAGDGTVGAYTVKVYGFNLGEQGALLPGEFADMARAKHAAAEFVRKELARV